MKIQDRPQILKNVYIDVPTLNTDKSVFKDHDYVKVFSVKFAIQIFGGTEGLFTFDDYKRYCAVKIKGNDVNVLRIGSKNYCDEICGN